MAPAWRNLAASAVAQGSPAAARLQRFQEAVDPGMHPLWAAGLKGQGQVVGVGDSGVDMDSCFFFDPKVGHFRRCCVAGV
jgi:hypothetical protein